VGSVGSTAVFEPSAKMPRPKAGPPALERRPANVARLFCSLSLAAEITLRVAGMAAVKKKPIFETVFEAVLEAEDRAVPAPGRQ
jgi:hypothetical protein